MPDTTSAAVPDAGAALAAEVGGANLVDQTLTATAQAAALDQCAATNYGLTYGFGHWLPSATFKIRLASLPFGNAATAIRAGHSRWNDTSNTCGFNDTAESTNFAYGGDSGSTGVHTYSDQISVIDFGDISNFGKADSTVIARTMNWTFNGRIAESDTRLSTSRTWTTSGAAGAFDIEAVMTHEVGHRAGLVDIYDDAAGNLTMFHGTTRGSTKQRTLGRGDIYGMRALY